MIQIKILSTAGIEHGLQAMRNPLNSWELSTRDGDIELSTKLHRAGTEHCKHLRLMYVYMEIKASRFWWQEFDTYRQGVEKISCSTMHKLFEKGLSVKDFDIDHQDYDVIDPIIQRLNKLRLEYQRTKNVDVLVRAKKLLPESFMQTRTVCISYQALDNMINQRKGHKLNDWKNFCKFSVASVKDFAVLTGREVEYFENKVKYKAKEGYNVVFG